MMPVSRAKAQPTVPPGNSASPSIRVRTMPTPSAAAAAPTTAYLSAAEGSAGAAGWLSCRAGPALSVGSMPVPLAARCVPVCLPASQQ